MFRRHKKTTAILTALLLAALQLHGVLHMLGHAREDARDEANCSLCVQSLHQQGVEAAPVPQATGTVLGFAALESSILSAVPRFRGFSPSLRAPPAVS